MRINVFLASATGMSRRAADNAVAAGRVNINGRIAILGQAVGENDKVKLDDRLIAPASRTVTIMLNKPVGYVCSRAGQGSRTIYELLPAELHHLKPVGRLDKDSSGLLLLTNDGQLANRLTHPKHQKQKVYSVTLNKALKQSDERSINKKGVLLEDGLSKLRLTATNRERTVWQISMSEGRNRQIRRTFSSSGYRVVTLCRTDFGQLSLGKLQPGSWSFV